MKKETSKDQWKDQKAIFLDPRTLPNCKKPWKEKRIEVLKMVLPPVVEYCIENIKKVMVEKYDGGWKRAGGILDHLLKALMSDELKDLEMKGKDGSIQTGQTMAESLMETIAYVAVVDVSPR